MNDESIRHELAGRDKPRTDDYLWSRTGPVDADVARLESVLSSMRYSAPRPSAEGRLRIGNQRNATQLRAAAILAIAIGGVWLASLLQKSHQPPGALKDATAAWEVTALEGAPRIGTARLAGTGRLSVGQWLETDASSQARIAVATIGTVTIDAHSRVRLIESSEHQHRIKLARGRIEAFITAPPRLFFVDTPAATAVDLGCKYNLTVGADGSGLLEVTLGWVSFESTKGAGGLESIVPRDAACKTRSGVGAGTPYYLDASPRLRTELDRFDFAGRGHAALHAVLQEARSRDSLTLWHLLWRCGGDEREAVFERLAGFHPPPPGVDRTAIMNGDRDALRAWRDEFSWSPLPVTWKG